MDDGPPYAARANDSCHGGACRSTQECASERSYDVAIDTGESSWTIRVYLTLTGRSEADPVAFAPLLICLHPAFE